MATPSRETYDAVIIGAGIGGLVCGCYLARAGLKVLIVEQHNKPGGYCTSFKRRGVTFDAAAHCFGSLRKDGIMDWVFEDLGLNSILKVKRYNPSDSIISPDGHQIDFFNNQEDTINSIKKYFPEDEGAVRTLFTHLMENHPSFFSSLRNLTFKDLLDRYLKNEKLKKILSFPFIGLGGLPASRMSAFVATKLFSEFLLDGGYYPEGGMQSLSNALAERLIYYKGNIMFSSRVRRIRTYKNRVTGVVLDNNRYIPSKYVISNCNAYHTFLRFIDKNKIDIDFRDKIKNMEPSLSNFVLYIGLKSYDKKDISPPGTCMWLMKNYNYERAYNEILSGDIYAFGGCTVRVLPSRQGITATMPALFRTKNFWKKHKERVKEFFLENILQVFPALRKHISFVDAATPQTLYRYTLNHRGASFGWAGTVEQFGIYKLRKPSFLKNLFLVGHWTTLGSGVSGVAYTGYDTANLILKKEPLTV
ncbi:MAG: NAD(P)/FAD-dependent oxidoreductase [Nitrospirae bacterium]|nr:MAG: NAD(P)/FAD-dependent oxidoreductase [Nitrospirota bacterium]